jgi:hypothetical protein
MPPFIRGLHRPWVLERNEAGSADLVLEVCGSYLNERWVAHTRQLRGVLPHVCGPLDSWRAAGAVYHRDNGRCELP